MKRYICRYSMIKFFHSKRVSWFRYIGKVHFSEEFDTASLSLSFYSLVSDACVDNLDFLLTFLLLGILKVTCTVRSQFFLEIGDLKR